MFKFRFLGYSVIVGLLMFGLTLVANPIVHAQSTTTSNTTQTQSTNQTQDDSLSEMIFTLLGTILNIIYLITLPLLIVAGKAVDNSMVYGEFMNFDTALYSMRNVSRTLANFLIGGILLFLIFKFIFSKENNPDFFKKFIINALLVVVGINISRFAIGMLLDLSTIATYSLGSLPLGAIKEVNKGNDMPLLGIFSFLDYQSDGSNAPIGQQSTDPYIYYHWGNINIPQCDKLYYGIITGPEYFPTIANTNIDFKQGLSEASNYYCGLNPLNIANITSLENWKNENLKGSLFGIEGELNNQEKNKIMQHIISDLNNGIGCDGNLSIQGPNAYTGMITSSTIQQLGSILQFGDGRTYMKLCAGQANEIIIQNNAINNKIWYNEFLDENNGNSPYNNQPKRTLENLINQSEGMVGPFVTLYVTLLDFSNLSNINTSNNIYKNTVGGFIQFFLKAIIAIALLIPLIALTIVLLLRVFVLRILIVAAPLGIVLAGVGTGLGGGNIGEKSILGLKINISNTKEGLKTIIGLIFTPVLPVFAIGLSIILLQSFQLELNTSINSDNQAREFFGIQNTINDSDPSINCIDFRGMQQLCYKTDPATDVGGGFINMIPRLFLNFIGIGLMRMMIKVAFSANSVTRGVTDQAMKRGAKAAGTIPIPGLGIGANTLGNLGNTISGTIDEVTRNRLNDENRQRTDNINKYFGKTDKDAAFKINNVNEVKTEFLNTAAQNQTAAQNIHTRIANFQNTLTQAGDLTAAQSYANLSSDTQKTEELLSYIAQLGDDAKDVDKSNLVKSIINPKLQEIQTATGDDKQALQDTLKQYLNINMTKRNITTTELKTYIDSQYQTILEEILQPTP